MQLRFASNINECNGGPLVKNAHGLNSQLFSVFSAIFYEVAIHLTQLGTIGSA
jgi:hypothetical protein